MKQRRIASFALIWLLSAAALFTIAAEDAEPLELAGVVRDAKGEAVEGAEVVVILVNYRNRTRFDASIFPEQPALTSEDGRFSIEVAQDMDSHWCSVVARKEGVSIGWRSFHGKREKNAPALEITLGKSGALAGRVVNRKGEPVENATVRAFLKMTDGQGQEQWLIGLAPFEWLSCQSGTDGGFAIAAIPEASSAEFQVTAAGHAEVMTMDWSTGSPVLQYSPGQTNITITCPVEARATGRVMSESDGEPAEGIELVATRLPNPTPYSAHNAISGEDGSFEFRGLSDGGYKVALVRPEVSEPHAVGAPVDIEVSEGSVTTGVVVNVNSGGCLEVVVEEESTAARLSDAHVQVGRAGSRRSDLSVKSGDDGVGRLRLTPGEYTVSYVTHKDFGVARPNETVVVKMGETNSVFVKMASQPVISGTVLDEAGGAVSNVVVSVLPYNRTPATTDGTGSFTIKWDPQSWGRQDMEHALLARCAERGLVAMVEIDEGTKKCDVTLTRGMTVLGRVIDEDGNPIAKAKIDVNIRMGNMYGSLRDKKIFSDIDGRYEISSLPKDGNFHISASAAGHGRENVQVESDGHLVEADPIVLKIADQLVSGRVIDEDGKPVANASVSLSGNGQSHSQSKTDKEGKFTVKDVCAGEVHVYCHMQGGKGYGSARADAGDTDVEIVIGERSGQSRQQELKLAASLVGKPLPGIEAFELEMTNADLNDSSVLVCFWDKDQRPSRHCVQQLTQMAAKLGQEGIKILTVHATDTDAAALAPFSASEAMYAGIVRDESQKTLFNWGVRGLPWLILTDSKHVVRADGFAITELDEKRMIAAGVSE